MHFLLIDMTQKEISKNWYERARKQGRCPRCGKPLDRQGFYCKACKDAVNRSKRENREFYRQHGLCTVCGKNKVFGDERTCPECRAKSKKKPSEEQRIKYNEKFKEYSRSLYADRKEKGICTRCGKRKAEKGKAKCGICLLKDAKAHRREFSKQDYTDMGLCYKCGKPVKEGFKLCEECYEDNIKNLKKAWISPKRHRWDNSSIFKKSDDKEVEMKVNQACFNQRMVFANGQKGGNDARMQS